MIFAVAIGGPALAGLLLLVRPSKDVSTLGVAATLGAGAVLMRDAVREGASASAGFQADPWRAALVCGIALVTIAAFVRRGGTGERTEALTSFGVAASVATVTATHAAAAVAGLVVMSGAIAARALLDGGRDAVRAAAAVAAACAVTAWAIASGGWGATMAAVPEGWSARAAAVGAAAFAIGPGSVRWMQAWIERSAEARALLLGAGRVVGLMVAAWLVRGDDARATLAVVAALAAAAAARRAAGSASWQAAIAASAGLVLVGLGTATPAALWGVAIGAAGLALTTAMRITPERVLAIPSLAAAPLGATFAGAALIASEAMSRAVVDRGWLLVAAGSGLALLWLVVSAATLHPQPETIGHARLWVIAPALGAAGALAVVPGTVATGIGPRFSASLSGVAPLPVIEPSVTDGLGIAFVIGAVIASVVVRGTWPHVQEAHDPIPEAIAVGRSVVVPLVLTGVAALAVVPLVIAGIDRGWL